MIRLIVCDMDGSLLDDDKKLPANFNEIFNQIRLRNIQFVIASGRQYQNLRTLFEPIKDECIFVAENGALIMHHDKCYKITSLQTPEVRAIIKKGRLIKNADILFCGLQSVYIEHDYKPLWDYAHQYYTNIQLVDSLLDVKDECLKITMCDFENVQQNSYQNFKDQEDLYTLAISGTRSLDINSKKANKGNAVSAVQKKLHISPEETMIFGDQMNDLNMFRYAKYSYAMKNAASDIKAAARFVTHDTNNENGVLKTIEKEILQQ